MMPNGLHMALDLIDWQRIVLDLRQIMSCRALDKKLNRHLDYTAKIARGEIQEPRYSDGVLLLALHQKLCKEKLYENRRDDMGMGMDISAVGRGT